MPASLGINYTPCQPADARSTDGPARESRFQTRKHTRRRGETERSQKGSRRREATDVTGMIYTSVEYRTREGISHGFMLTYDESSATLCSRPISLGASRVKRSLFPPLE